jgi:hypothetical protein
VIDNDWAFTEPVEVEPVDGEDVEEPLAVVRFCVIVIDRQVHGVALESRGARQANRILIQVPGRPL